ncbi:hypothetical protein F2Q69_00052133 [Brassica cretica]|uniref:Uncharacterized protein n=1 Tax=Brassica cretica TaxID=69181 RepID=A0A8S9MV32_BRACR|nr:hypothetical protein F2Q69_00052133 [Brassica cretica]
MSVRHKWLVCKLHTAPTVDKKALPTNREEFQFSLMSKTWKSTGTRALPICTFRSLTIPPEFLWEQSIKVNNSCEGSTRRPRWSAITLGRMLTDAHVSNKACGNSIPFTVQEHSPMSSSVSLVSLKNIHNLVLPVGTLSTSIGSTPSSEGVLTVSGGFSKGLGLGLSALRRATSIFGICTRRGRRSILDDFCRSMSVAWR